MLKKYEVIHSWYTSYLPQILSLSCFVVLILVFSLLIDLLFKHWEKDQQITLDFIALQQADRLENDLNHSLSVAFLLGKYLEESPDGLDNITTANAKRFFDRVNTIESIQFAPSGIIEQVYPDTDRNRRAIGLNLLENDDVEKSVSRAINTGQLTLAGPVELVQGGYGIVARQPIYVEQNGRSSFWGFVSVLISIRNLINDQYLEQLNLHHITYRVTTGIDLPPSQQFVFGDENFVGDIHTEVEILLVDRPWRLEFYQDLPNQSMLLIIQWVIALLISGLSAGLVYKLISSPYKVAQQIDRYTAKLSNKANIDRLTGLMNREALKVELRKVLAQTRSQSTLAAIIYIGIDDFRRINDAFGNSVGDQVLVQTAELLQQVCSKQNKLGRVGGDEFVIVLLHQYSQAFIDKQLQHILKSLNHSMTINKQEIQFSTSAGVALIPQDGENENQLLQRANLAMAQAKRLGKNRFAFFQSDMEQQAKSILTIEMELTSAIRNNELVLFYQPIVDLAKDRAVGFEALIRWQHPSRGLIFPDAFIPVAEQSKLIVDVGYWVIESACQTLSQLPEPLYISINLSARQFVDVNLVDKIKAIVERYQIDPRRLTLEITETLLIENLDQVIASLHELRAFGTPISVDDFGTGHSSLNKLKIMPVDTLKIDRSFIMDLPANHEDRQLTEAILQIAQKLDLKVVAEGIETLQQRDFLAAHQCEFGQGYYFSKPIPLQQALDYLNAQT